MSDLRGVTPPLGAGIEAREATLQRAAKEFEAMFVELLLESAKIPFGGEEALSPIYGDMATGAWSGELSRAGGFGLADLLVRAVHDRETAGHASTEPPLTEAPLTEAPLTEAPLTEATVRPEFGAARYRAIGEAR